MRNIRFIIAASVIIASMVTATSVVADDEVHKQINTIASDCALTVIQMRRSPEAFFDPEKQRAAYAVAEMVTSQIGEFQLLLKGNKADERAAAERGQECLQAFRSEAARLGW